LKVSSERLPSCQLRLRFEVDPEEMQGPLKRAYQRLAHRIAIPGFRRGKAPPHILERHVGRQTLLQEALNDLIPQLYEQAIKEQGIEPFAGPELELLQLDPPIFEARVPLPPRVELGDYHAIKVTPDEVEITEEQVEEALEGLRRSQAYWQPAERPCRLDDIVVLDIRGEVEGEPLFDEKERWYRLTSGATWPAPGFVQRVLGMSKGEGKEFVLPLPADFPESQFAGKECHFKVFLHEVKEENIPELNDDFAKSLDWEVNSLEELRGKMKARLRERAEQEAKSKLEREVLEALVGFSEVEFPPILVEMEINQLIGEELRRRGWPSLEDFLRNLGKSEEELREELRPLAEERLTRSLVLGKVAEQENIRVDESEIEAEIERLSASAGERREELHQLLSSRGRESIRNELLTRKTLERLVEIALKEEPEGPAEQTSEN